MWSGRHNVSGDYRRSRCRGTPYPAEGYYEWQKDGSGKIPTYLHPEDEGIVAFAGL